MNSLALRRPTFHSEADFQFEFAWELVRLGLGSVRLEKPVPMVGEVDLVVEPDEQLIEFKYKTKSTSLCHNLKQFKLKGHGAQPLGRYDVLKDLGRIESSKRSGYAIFLTNDSLYWRTGSRGNGADFSLEQGRQVAGLLQWRDSSKITSLGKDRVYPINIKGIYSCNWVEYSRVGQEVFKFLIFAILPTKDAVCGQN